MAAEYEPSEIYIDLRDQVLSLSPQQINSVEGKVLAVLMETGYSEAVASLVAVADGTVSIYFSNGGGIIGSGEYPQVRDVGLELISEAGLYLKQLSKTEIYPLPKKSFTTFYVVTKSGTYTASVLEDDLGNERHDLSPIFFAGHKLIAYVRAADEYRRTAQEAATDH